MVHGVHFYCASLTSGHSNALYNIASHSPVHAHIHTPQSTQHSQYTATNSGLISDLEQLKRCLVLLHITSHMIATALGFSAHSKCKRMLTANVAMNDLFVCLLSVIHSQRRGVCVCMRLCACVCVCMCRTDAARSALSAEMVICCLCLDNYVISSGIRPGESTRRECYVLWGTIPSEPGLSYFQNFNISDLIQTRRQGSRRRGRGGGDDEEDEYGAY